MRNIANIDFASSIYLCTNNLNGKEMMNVIVPVNNYDLTRDSRVIIPFFESGKVGFMDHYGAIVVDPQYDSYRGEFDNENDLVVVSKDYLYAYECNRNQLIQ